MIFPIDYVLKFRGKMFNSTWNDLNDVVSDRIRRVYEAVIPALLYERNVSPEGIEGLANLCRQCMVLGIMENEYDEFGVDNFFRACLKVLLQGHLVCGYEGEYPRGKLIVF